MLALAVVPGSGKVHDVVAWTFYVLIMGTMLLIPWMILFAWPRFLVPPAFRGQPGWLVTTLRQVRAKQSPHRP
jgi:hypothetical protein